MTVKGKSKKSGLSARPLREDLVTQAILEAYGAVRHEGRLSDRALEYVLRSRKHLYANERRAVAERVYALLRRQRLVDFLLERAFPSVMKSPVTTQDLHRLAISRILDGEELRAVADSIGFRGPEVKALEQLPKHREALEKVPPKQRFAIEASMPDFLAAKFQAQFGKDAMVAAEAMNHRATLTVRANGFKTDRGPLKKALEAEGVHVKETLLSPLGLTLETRVNVYSLATFKDGLFEVQDEGSQLLGMLVDGPPRRVIDACAGAGGKTLQVAVQMKNRGDLFALDVDERRLEDLKQRARRAGVHNCRVHGIPPEGPEADAAVAQWKDSAERVLVDAPCSGSGTYRRKPDARYKLDAEMLADHVRRQKVLIERFSTMVKPGGRLIYGTCSIFRDENEDVVEDFLKRHPEFSVQPVEKWLGQELAAKVSQNGFLRLFPHLHDTDGFFGAVLERKR